jgi:hypothetical protein
MTLVTAEVIWLKWLLEDFGISVSMSTPLLSDSTGAISIARDPVKHELTMNIGVDAHFTRSQVHDGVVALQYGHKFMMVLSLFSMCLQSSSWQISSQRLKLASNINFISPNSVFLIHHEFKGGY